MHQDWSARFQTGLGATDDEIAGLLARQSTLNADTINLVASESYCPRATLEAEASSLINKNASGHPPRKSVGASEILDAVEGLAVARARRLFGAEHANIQALSSTIANVAVLKALLAPGDTILSFDPAEGGHQSHGGPNHYSGQTFTIETFGVSGPDDRIDYNAVAAQARTVRPKMIIAGTTGYPIAIDFARLNEIAREVGALFFADIAHVAGLVVAGLHVNPVPFADVVTTSTHKTLCGPRTGGLILCRQQYAEAIDRALSPGIQAAGGGHIMAARAVLFRMVAQPWFTRLMEAVTVNAKALAEGISEGGVRLYAGGTNTHMVVVDLRAQGWESTPLNRHLLAHGIVASTTNLPKREADRGQVALRLGSTAMTIRGAEPATIRSIGRHVAALVSGSAAEPHPEIGAWVREAAHAHPIPFQDL